MPTRPHAPHPFTLIEPLEARRLLSAAFDLVGLTALRADARYTAVDGSDVGVAIIDTGLYGAHPDLAPNLVAWYDAVGRTGGNGVSSAFDPEGHGSHVAGTAAARNPAIGVATRASLIAVRGLAADTERQPGFDTVAQGLSWVIDHQRQYNIRVVNLSLGNPDINSDTPLGQSSEEARRIAQLQALGVTVVTASGNGYAAFAAPGASFPAVVSTISVADTWEDDGRGDGFPSAGSGGQDWAGIEYGPRADQFAATSQRSTLPNQVAAPGSTIYSAWNGAQGKLYNTISGTSMAAPLVTGAVALMQDAAFTYGGRYLDPAQVLQIIRDTADAIIDTPTASNARARITTDSGGRTTLGAAQDLPETGLSFRRLNIYNAVRRVRELVTGVASPGAPAGDLNNTIAAAASLPALDGARSGFATGSIGKDGQTQIGAADTDLFRVTLSSPGFLTVTLERLGGSGGVAFNPYVRLFDAAGAEIAAADDAGANPYPTLRSGRLDSGTYYVGVSGSGNRAYAPLDGSGAADGGSRGDYQATVALSNPDPNGVFAGAVVFGGLPEMFNGSIGSDEGRTVGPHDVDAFEVVTPDDGTLTVDIRGESVHGVQAVDSAVRVFNEAGVQLVLNDDRSPSNLDPFITLRLTKGQRVFVAVSDYQNVQYSPTDPFAGRSGAGTGGLYDIYLSFDNGDLDGTIPSAGALTVGAVSPGLVGRDGLGTGTLVGGDGTKDVDFYAFTPAADAIVDLSATADGGALTPDLSLWTVSGAAADVQRVGGSAGAAPRLLARVAAGRTYYVAVTGRGNGDFNWSAPATGSGGTTGGYRLTSAYRPTADAAALTDNAVGAGTPRAIALDAPVDAQLGADGPFLIGAADVDLYRFDATETRTVEVRTSIRGESGADTVLRLFDESGAEIAFNDDAAAGTLASAARVRVTAGRAYYFGVNGYSTAARAYDPLTGAGAADGATGSAAAGSGSTADAGAYQITVRAVQTPVAPAASAPGGFLVASLDPVAGGPVVYRGDGTDAGWTVADLSALPNGPDADAGGDPVSWTSPRDGRAYVAVPTADGLLLYTNTSAPGATPARWTVRNLTAELGGGATPPGANLTVFTSPDGVVHVAGLDAAGDLVVYRQLPDAGGETAWDFLDLSRLFLAPAGLSTPTFSGRLVSYVTTWGALNVAGLDGAGRIQVVWYSPELSIWTATDLTAATGAPTYEGGLVVYLTSWGGINLAGITGNGNLAATWWVPGFGGQWRFDDLTAETGGPRLAASSTTSYVSSWDGLNIAGLDAAGDTVMYWWSPAVTAQGWQVFNFSTANPGAPRLTGRLSGLATLTGTLNVFGSTAAGSIVRGYWTANGPDQWAFQDLTATARPG